MKSMKAKSLQIILLFGLAAALLPLTGRAQSQLVDCVCLAKLQALQTNACLATIPDLCALVGPCLLSPPPLQCSQTPPPGGQVGPGTYPITVTFTDSQGLQQVCNVGFVVTPLASCVFTLNCASNKTVECGTQWNFNPPTWTNACVPPPGTPSNGVILTIVSTITNGTCPQVITRTWQGMDDCGYHAQCSQTVTVVDTTAPVLSCSCLTNSAVYPVTLTVIACTGTIPDLCLPASVCASDNCGLVGCSQSPPAGTGVGIGVHPITVTVYDCASNAASCVVNFTVIAPAGGCAFSLICSSNKTVECGTQWNFNPPTWTNACVPAAGTVSNGVLTVSQARPETIQMMGVTLPPSMGMATAINFQSAGSGKVAATGDFVMVADEVNKVARTLRQHGIEIAALHNHMLHGSPELYFMHFWAVGDAAKISAGLKAALADVKH